MKKIISKKIEKIWGYEIWMYSPVKGMETTFEDGKLTTHGPLIKIIQANRPLSVQVHPDDDFAKELENEENGKTESWYILNHDPDAKIVIGLKHYDEQIIRKKISDGLFEDNLKFINVKIGDFFNIPAGLVHGIGAGIKVLEVQQPSDTTYRYFDYNRLENGKPRELHIDKAIKVQKKLAYNLEPISQKPLTYKNAVGRQIFCVEPSTLKEDSIVIDLNNEVAYLAEKNEMINFSKYVIVSLWNT
ncbi:class I mannose-6-phosphate isomerase [Candidatus Mycoplasma mahonii]|uniref:class I mannose-6-phosphate isomerase n=1 Tax=Candidatus Mycoplasma mahonii TaxID=3004105 RepID=UPI0026EF1A85|nr:class I mannose-6-phosphate isomerase [Candidatus Mycoplasma mahonii]WKX02749.1 class I mannose-6-phosphate isomerase [Candidatus Mycoplasma mahonii]